MSRNHRVITSSKLTVRLRRPCLGAPWQIRTSVCLDIAPIGVIIAFQCLANQEMPLAYRTVNIEGYTSRSKIPSWRHGTCPSSSSCRRVVRGPDSVTEDPRIRPEHDGCKERPARTLYRTHCAGEGRGGVGGGRLAEVEPLGLWGCVGERNRCRL